MSLGPRDAFTVQWQLLISAMVVTLDKDIEKSKKVESFSSLRGGGEEGPRG